jgi:hypothetical protein
MSPFENVSPIGGITQQFELRAGACSKKARTRFDGERMRLRAGKPVGWICDK